MKIPTYESSESINPTPINPEMASTTGRMVKDLGKGLESLSEHFEAMRNKTQALKAETSLADITKKNWEIATTDPDIDGLQKKIDDNFEKGIQDAAGIIKDPTTRDTFVERARAEADRKSVGIYNRIYQRQNKDYKDQITKANDADVSDYQMSADPAERNLIKQKSFDRVEDGIQNGYLHQDAKKHLQKVWEQADIDQIQKDAALDPDNAYKQLQKGQEGIYKDVPEGKRKYWMDKVQKQIEKDGAEDKHAFGIAQNHTDNLLIDKMAQNKLTVDDVVKARTQGINGIPASDKFSNAVLKALQDPFPTDSDSDKYNKLVNMVTDPDVDPMTAKINVMTSRGLTPQQKAHLINAGLREDPTEGKQSINELIESGIKKNKQQIMEADKRLKNELADRNGLFRKLTARFRDQSKDDDHLAKLQQDYYSQVQNAKNNQDRIDIANKILNNDTLTRNPGIKTADPKGTIFMDKTTGVKRRYFPSGYWESIKSNE